MKIKLLVTLLAFVGIGTAYGFAEVENVKEYISKDRYVYEVCPCGDWESSECTQAREAFVQCATELYPQLPQLALEFIL